MELLSPVKNLKAAKIAINSGCDAIYFGSPSFSARTAANIEHNEIKEIIKLAQMYEVKTYAAFNIVIFDDELEKFYKEIDELYKDGIDAIIVQDFGQIKKLRETFPNLDVHASTQMHVHNIDGVNSIVTEGANRVVLPREMTFEQINQITEQQLLETEIFIHGALCVSYSGQCYDSVLLDQKSANRGRCSQYCRRTFSLVNKTTAEIKTFSEKLLNLKDMNNLSNIDKYHASKIDSLKIEGRLKREDYTYLVTKAYKKDQNIDLADVYNRTFSTGFINGEKVKDLVNLKRENNTGKLIGKVIKVEKNMQKDMKYYNYQAKLEINTRLKKLDNLRFVNENSESGEVVEQFIQEKNIVTIYLKNKIQVNDQIYRTSNQRLLDEARDASEKYLRRNEKIIDLIISKNKAIIIYQNESLEVELITEVPQKKATTHEDILRNLSKTKDTPFDLKVNLKYQEEYFIPQKSIKQLKNIILNLVTMSLIKTNESLGIPKFSFENSLPEDKEFFVEVKTKEQLEVADNYKVNILINNLELAEEVEVKENYYLVTPRIIYEDSWTTVDRVANRYSKLCVSEIGALNRYKRKKEIISNFTFNTTNNQSKARLHELGVNKTVASIELNLDKLNNLAANTITLVYGKIPVMIYQYCPINPAKRSDCGKCKMCQENDYSLIDYKEQEFPLIKEEFTNLGMYNNEPISLHQKLESININSYLIKLTNETPEKTEEVLNVFLKQKKADYAFNLGTLNKVVL